VTGSLRIPGAGGVLVALAVGLAPMPAAAQQAVERGRSVAADVSIKMWVPAGSVRLMGWDRDSILVRGTVPSTASFYLGGTRSSLKLDVSAPSADSSPGPAHLEIFLPRGGQVSLKTVTASITGTDVTGWISTVSGTVDLRGRARRLEVETLDGPLTLQVEAAWVRARTGNGRLTIEGRVDDIRASTVSGAIVIRNKYADRALFESITGDISYAGAFSDRGTMEFDSHSGTVTLALPERAEGHFRLTSVAGRIDNTLTSDRPRATADGGGEELVFSRGADAARIIVRAFKGSIILRRM